MNRTSKVAPNQLCIFDALNRVSFEKSSYLGNSHSIVYFVYAPAVNRIKIGITKAGGASGRLSTLQTGSPVTLILVGTVPGGLWEEAKYHNLFRLNHHHGEWFDVTPPMKKFIDDLVPDANWELFPDTNKRRDGQAYLKSLSSQEIEKIECELRCIQPIQLQRVA